MQDTHTKHQHKTHTVDPHDTTGNSMGSTPGKLATETHSQFETKIPKHFEPVSGNAENPTAVTGFGRAAGCGLLSGLAAGVGQWLWGCVLNSDMFDE
jgi:hypothetical protein